MFSVADTLDVFGEVSFDGQSTVGLMTAGVIKVGANLWQDTGNVGIPPVDPPGPLPAAGAPKRRAGSPLLASTDPSSFAPSGTHAVIFDGIGTIHDINITWPSSSMFNDLFILNSAAVSVNTAMEAWVQGNPCYNPMALATVSRWRVASPNMSSAAFALRE